MTTQIHFILDRSGSMSYGLDDYIGGFNSFLDNQSKENSDEVLMSLYQFDHNYEIVHQNIPIKEVEKLNKDNFIPRGRTALLDAVGTTLNNINKKNNESIIIVVLTDGEEDCSSKFTGKKISKMINQKIEEGWEFIYLGANQDAILEGSKIGINKNSRTFCVTPEGINDCFNSLNHAISDYRKTPMKMRKEKGVSFKN